MALPIYSSIEEFYAQNPKAKVNDLSFDLFRMELGRIADMTQIDEMEKAFNALCNKYGLE